jgi:hypothetical protein
MKIMFLLKSSLKTPMLYAGMKHQAKRLSLEVLHEK